MEIGTILWFGAMLAILSIVARNIRKTYPFEVQSPDNPSIPLNRNST